MNELGVPSTTWDEKSIVKSVLKALSLLELFSPEMPELSVAELAQRTGIQKATCNRLVTTMTHAGWLTRVGNGGYAPTVKLFRIGSTAISRLNLREGARPLLRDLAKRFEDTSYLMVPDGPRVVCLDRVEGNHPVTVKVFDVGMSLPFYLGAGPLAILAHRDDLLTELDPHDWIPYTDQTTSNPHDLQERLAEVRERGYALSLEDYSRGVAAIGAPVFNSEGVAIAAISIGGVVERFRQPRRTKITRAVVDAARALSEQLGYGGTYASAGPGAR